ncbi:MAG TPA: thiamine pyrophosphate-dependent enzyme [Candidatus Wujingus californicus]|uniref:thiamine pyrophosphate-dependent enzyme n=1 Tax=Candidatus Wujingus californicus TaxID=3367618 RepID=UPI0040254611
MDRDTNFKRYLKLELLPTPWCPGCGNGIVLKTVCQAFDEIDMPKNGTVVISGIGCAGRSAGFFDLDSVHTAHGRAIPVAEGIKYANESLNVVVLSGDGDLLGIGGNHLLHAIRRNTNITVVCYANETYGMTGGQVSPTTPYGTKTLTTPDGNKDTPADVQYFFRNPNSFFARTTAYHLNHMKKCIVEALKFNGFSFVEVRTMCIVNYGRRLGYKNSNEMLLHYKDFYKVNDNTVELAQNEIGILKYTSTPNTEVVL